MILNTASQVIYNGASVNSVIYNGQVIWPSTPTGTYPWTASGRWGGVYTLCPIVSSVTADASIIDKISAEKTIYYTKGTASSWTETGVTFNPTYTHLNLKFMNSILVGYAPGTTSGLFQAAPFSSFLCKASGTAGTTSEYVKWFNSATSHAFYTGSAASAKLWYPSAYPDTRYRSATWISNGSISYFNYRNFAPGWSASGLLKL